MISCGCIAIDPSARKVAILRDTTDPSFCTLPKGRKNINEDLLAAALRETYEETGLCVEPLPLRVATRATPPAGMHLEKMSKNPDVTESVDNCEPTAVSMYPCGHTGAFKLVFWFAARGDSQAVPDEGTMETWEEHYKMEWVDARDAAGHMSFEADGQVIEKVLVDMRKSGYEI